MPMQTPNPRRPPHHIRLPPLGTPKVNPPETKPILGGLRRTDLDKNRTGERGDGVEEFFSIIYWDLR